MKNTSKNNIKKAQSFVTILGIKINSTRKGELLKEIEEKILFYKRNRLQKRSFYIVTPNPEIVLQAQSDPELAHSLNSADFSVPDGFGLKFAAPELQIIKGRELFLDLLKIANDKKLKVYLLGGRDFVNKKALNILISQYPNIIAAGAAGPQFNKNAEPVSEIDIALQFEIVKEINSFKPDLLFVAFGTPREQKWIAKNLPKLKAVGAMEVGGTFDYYSGIIRPVPNFLGKVGLEWLWRLIQEPKRVRRIFNAVTVFPLKVILSKISP